VDWEFATDTFVPCLHDKQSVERISMHPLERFMVSRFKPA
jgi:hypothetical protein